ncbi:MAG: alkaline phosphatase [Bacteroidota bacterium]
MIKKKIVLILFIVIFGLCKAEAQSTPKYIFLFIGDGMGLNQVFLTEKYLDYFKTDSIIFLNPSWKSGLMKTDCLDSFRITESAAAGTAIACGSKTNYGMIGMSKAESFQSVTEYMEKENFKIGVLTNVPLNHATPASFFGHEPTRNNYDNLINDLIASNFDFFAGGGFLLGNADTSKNIYKNFDQVLAILKEKKFNLVLNSSVLTENNKIFTLPVILIDTVIRNKQMKVKGAYIDEKNSLPYVIDFPEYKNILAEFTETAISTLKNDTGFFIMVEGGKIDWACHGNDAATAVHEVIAFNDAVKKAYEFYLKYPENTLIIVTADHETGGLTLGTGYDEYSNSTDNSYAFYPDKLALQKKSLLFSDKATVEQFNSDAQLGWTTNEHTASPVGVWAIGQGSENLLGIYENSEIKKKILELIK